ncbi:MAG: hypothetical protein Q8N94_08460 [Methanoregula sp.]|nr:hypothetical protein [Methanoregula sp.]
MPGEANVPQNTTEQVKEIPFHLISTVIADQVRKKRASVFFLITVEKTFHNYYIITVETRDEYALRVNQEAPARTEGDGHG